MSEARVIIAGCGAVGHALARQVAQCGPASLTLFDDDVVDVVNLAPQGFTEASLEQLKAEVVAEECRALNPAVNVVAITSRFSEVADGPLLKDAFVFACVDNMASRKIIHAAAAENGATWFGDTRTAGETSDLYAVPAPKKDDRYAASLYDSSEVIQASCSTKMTCYAATIAASLILCKFAQFIRGYDEEFFSRRTNLMEFVFEETPQ